MDPRHGRSHPNKGIMYITMNDSSLLATWTFVIEAQGLSLQKNLSKYKFQHVNRRVEVKHAIKSLDYRSVM